MKNNYEDHDSKTAPSPRDLSAPKTRADYRSWWERCFNTTNEMWGVKWVFKHSAHPSLSWKSKSLLLVVREAVDNYKGSGAAVNFSRPQQMWKCVIMDMKKKYLQISVSGYLPFLFLFLLCSAFFSLQLFPHSHCSSGISNGYVIYSK